VGATVGALTLAFVVFEWQNWSAVQADLVRDQVAVARSLAAEASLAVEGHDHHGAARAEAIFDNAEAAKAASYISKDGRRMELVRPDESAVELQPAGVTRDQVTYHPRHFDIRLPVIIDGRIAGEFVYIASEAENWRSLKRDLLAALYLTLASAIVTGIAARVLVRNILGPLGDLEQAIGRVSRTKDFSARVEARSEDELGRLTNGFNTLLMELDTYDGDLRQALAELTTAKGAAEGANVMKSEFLANMSHEIRTPLNGVLAMTQVMAMGSLSEAQRGHLGVVQKSGETLLSVLNDLLDISKIEAGRMELEDAPFDISELAAGATASFTSVANASGVSFAMSISEEAAGVWRGDSVRVRQILYNLISNALKFTQEGEVRVDIDSEPAGAGKALLIAISDSGIGIAPEVLPKLFQKFVQADSSTTRRFGGTGLGLTICREIAKLMGGSITAESQLGVGTVFRVRLPLPWLGPASVMPSPPAPSDAVPFPEIGLAGLRVLAAEDNTTNQLVLKTVLHSLGLQPVMVENGRLAVDAWLVEPFDIVLMDIQMPLMDGVAATREIRRLEKGRGARRTPIVALSANAMKHQVNQYLAAGMDAHLAKPIQIPRLYETLLAVKAGRALKDSKRKVAGA
jgi:signal transduction histidine kinase/AmiR/NasT family two-component response regulator